MRRANAVILAVFTTGAPALLAAAGDLELDKGIALVRQGEYGQAIIVLDPVARRLSQKPALSPQAAQAYLHLGIAYVGEGQETLARAAFRDALSRDATLQLNAFDVSPKVRELFQKAKDELAQQKLAAAPAKKGGGGKGVLIVLGVLAAGGAAAAAAAGGGGGDGGGSATTVTISINPNATSFAVGATVGFAALANGSCTGSQQATWSFGDGASGTSTGGTVISHTFNSKGTFTVAVSMQCDRTLTASVGITIS